MIEHHMSRQLMALTYGLSSAIIVVYAFWLYFMGHYGALLVPMFISLLLLTALLIHVTHSLTPYLSRKILLVSTYIVVLSALYHQPSLPLLWLGLPITMAFLLVPLGRALCFSLLSIPVWWVLDLDGLSPTFLYSIIVLLLLLTLPPCEHIRRRALLRATDPNDGDCDAYHVDTLKERLHNEFQRAALLNKRLATLVIHLPQLGMAEEQFGHRAKIALLGALCHEVNSRCRDHDLLGRVGNATFWLILPDTSESGALLVRERLIGALSQRVLVETGHLEAQIILCPPNRREAFERYVQRLEARTKALSNA